MAHRVVLDIDIHKSTLLRGESQAGPEPASVSKAFADYHAAIDKVVEEYGGDIWSRAGDGVICLLGNPERAIDAAKALLSHIRDINRDDQSALNGSVLFTRIGMHISPKSLQTIPIHDRDKQSIPDLNVVGHLQKNCPIGRIAISADLYEELELSRSLFRPSLIPGDFGRPVYVLIRRLITLQESRLLEGLSESQKRSLPPVPFLSWDRVLPPEGVDLRSLESFFAGPVLVVFGETTGGDRGSLNPAATSDAVGILEVMAALKSNRDVRVAIDGWADTADLVAERNILIVGSGIVNAYAFAINDIFGPLRFIKREGQVFDRVVGSSLSGSVTFGAHSAQPHNAGAISIARSPFNPDKSLLWVAGVNGMATQAAAAILKDLVVDAEAALRAVKLGSQAKPIACVVAPSLGPAQTELQLSEYYRKWRVLHYTVAWAVDCAGNMLIGNGGE